MKHIAFLISIIVYGILLSGTSYNALNNEVNCKDIHIRTYWLLLAVIGACMVSVAVTAWGSCKKVEDNTNNLPYIDMFLGLNVFLLLISSLLLAQYNNTSGCSADGKKTAVWYIVASVVSIVVCFLLKTKKVMGRNDQALLQRAQPGPALPPRDQVAQPVPQPVQVAPRSAQVAPQQAQPVQVAPRSALLPLAEAQAIVDDLAAFIDPPAQAAKQK